MTAPLPADIGAYHAAQAPTAAAVCAHLATALSAGLPGAKAKVWHGGPVWFLQDNPVAGYWVRKTDVQLLFWSGQSFRTPGLRAEGKFKAADARFADVGAIDSTALSAWLAEAQVIQWDYRNIVKRRGLLLPLGDWAA